MTNEIEKERVPTFTLWNYILHIYIYIPWLDSTSGPRPSHCWGSAITLTPYSVGLLLPSDHPVTGISTRQDATLSRYRHLCPDGIRTRTPSNRTPTDLRHTAWPLTAARTVIGLTIICNFYTRNVSACEIRTWHPCENSISSYGLRETFE